MSDYDYFSAPVGSEMRTARIDRPVNGFAHIYSDGTNVSSLFRSREDFIYGMNAMAITAYGCGISILTMQLMETHFHMIAKGSPRDCDAFVRSITAKLMMYLAKVGRRFAVKGLLNVSNDLISTERELMCKFMYVHRNAANAGFPYAPWEYEWGAGNIYFVNHSRRTGMGRRIDGLTCNDRRKMLRTKAQLPGDWRCDDEGKLLPHSYMDWEAAEALFRTVRTFLAFMGQRKDIEADIDRQCSSSAALHRLSETELRREANELCSRTWGLSSLSKASAEQRMEVAQRLWGDRRTYSLSVLSRVTMVDKGVLEGVFGKGR